MKSHITNRPAISVIMSAYNAEKYVAEAIESILNQTFKDFEFIIIEDGSKDKTFDIVKKYAEKDHRIKLLRNNKNIGYVGFIKNLNKCLAIAKGKYIARMDADDISLPKRFEIQYDFLQKNPSVFLVGTGMIDIYADGKEFKRTLGISGSRKIERILLERNCIVHPSIMFRNERMVRYREKAIYCEDYDLYLQLLLREKKLENIKTPLVKHRMHEGTVSVAGRLHQELFTEKIKELYLLKRDTSIDQYDLFDPKEILSKKINKDGSRIYDELYIESIFKQNKMPLVRRRCQKYFSKYGYFNRILIFFSLSFVPVFFLEYVRKILWKNNKNH